MHITSVSLFALVASAHALALVRREPEADSTLESRRKHRHHHKHHHEKEPTSGVLKVVFLSQPTVTHYFSQALNTLDGGFALTGDIKLAAVVEIPHGMCDDDDVDTDGFTLPLETAINPAFPYFSPASAKRSSNLAAPGAPDAGQFAPAALNTPGKADGATSASGDGYSVWSAEADTWSLNCDTRALSFQWDDPNGGSISAANMRFWARSTSDASNDARYFSQASTLKGNGGLEFALSLISLDDD